MLSEVLLIVDLDVRCSIFVAVELDLTCEIGYRTIHARFLIGYHIVHMTYYARYHM